jgi:hypothetical protein
MSDSTNSALSNASAFRRAGAPAQGGVIEALAKSPLNPFGLCGQDDASTAPADLEAGRIDITAGFDDAHRLSRRDIVDETRAAIAGERPPRHRGNDEQQDIFSGTSAQLATSHRPRREGLGSSRLAGVASTMIRGSADKALSTLAAVSVTPPGAPVIAIWLGTAIFVALPLLPDLGVPKASVVAPPESPQTAKPDQAGSSEIAMSLPEERPPIGTAVQFSRMNLRYCIYQEVRLEAIGPVTYSTESDVFSALIKDWNSRCSRFRHAAGDKEAIDLEVKARRTALEAEGRALVRGWQRKIETTLQHVPEPAAAVATSTPQRLEASDPLPAIITMGRNPKSELGWGFNPLLKSPSLVLLRSDSAMRVQERLDELGYTIKPADGNWGPTSRVALRHFKEANGLLANDGFDIETAVRLFSASASRAVAPTASSAGDATGTIESAYPPPPGATLNPLNRADAERIQRRLAALGYYGGKVYGLWGATSRKALHAFKTANDLADDDDWDAITETVLSDDQAVHVAAVGADGAAMTGPPPTTGTVKPDPSPRPVAKPAKRAIATGDDGVRPPAIVPAPTARPTPR